MIGMILDGQLKKNLWMQNAMSIAAVVYVFGTETVYFQAIAKDFKAFI